MSNESRSKWVQWSIQLVIPLLITLIANSLLLGKYIQKIDTALEGNEKLSVKVERLEAADKDMTQEIANLRTHAAVTDTRYDSIEKGISRIEATQIELMKALSRKKDR